MRKKLAISLMFIGLLTGCSPMKTLQSLNHSINSLSLDTDTKSSIIIWGKDIVNPYNIRGDGVVYLINTETNKEQTFILNTYSPLASATNIAPGKYKFSKWIYDACKIMSVDKYGKTTGCKERYRFKGNSLALSGGDFTVKEGETLYLGSFTLDSARKIISLFNYEAKDLKKLEFFVDLKGREVRNISEQINLKNWKFEITGSKGFLEF